MIMQIEDIIKALPKEKILGYENIEGIDYPLTDWSTVQDTFPNKLTIFKNKGLVEDNREFLCTLLAVSDYINSDEVLLDWLDRGLNISFLRTSTYLFSGLIC